MNNFPLDIRDAIFDEVYKIGQKDKDLIFIADDMDAFSLRKFKKDLSDQYINIGVAEQNMIDVAAGLASCGKTVICFGISSYVTARCFEQIKFSVASMHLPVIIIGIGAGFSFNFDGPTHQGTIDIGIMRLIPEMTIINPSDAHSAANAVRYAYGLKKPAFIRLDKGAFPKIHTKSLGKFGQGFKIVKPLKKTNVITTGYMTSMVLNILEELNNLEIGLVDLYQLKPIQPQFINEVLKKSSKIITVEEHSILGGLATIISELVALDHLPILQKSLGIKDHQFDVFGSREYLQSLNGLDPQSLKDTIKRFYGD